MKANLRISISTGLSPDLNIFAPACAAASAAGIYKAMAQENLKLGCLCLKAHLIYCFSSLNAMNWIL